MDIQQKTMKSPSKDSSDSPDKKRKFLEIAPLLKPVALSMSNSYGLDWYMINVENNIPRKKRRYFVNLSFFSDQLHKFIPHSLHLLKYPNWTTIFLATTPRGFMYYQAHFPMKPILTFTPMIMKLRAGHLPMINNSRPSKSISVIRRRRK